VLKKYQYLSLLVDLGDFVTSNAMVLRPCFSIATVAHRVNVLILTTVTFENGKLPVTRGPFGAKNMMILILIRSKII
jgi:hypothetical protein